MISTLGTPLFELFTIAYRVDKALSRNSKENSPKTPQAFDSASVHLTFMTNSVSPEHSHCIPSVCSCD
ncbi:hypothetical protein EON63_14475 [archaeon]|nr:MAG: hypothetical protein EON63_14475 [archaeon]